MLREHKLLGCLSLPHQCNLIASSFMTNNIVLNYKYLFITSVYKFFFVYLPYASMPVKDIKHYSPFQGRNNLGSQQELESINTAKKTLIFISVCLFPWSIKGSSWTPWQWSHWPCTGCLREASSESWGCCMKLRL